jgi:hypothetical protein
MLRYGNDNFWPGWGSPGDLGEYLAHYPTDFTRGVLPVPCHSHNDYWRRIPLYEAIHYGCTSVEADVWNFNGDLYVGHEESSLTVNRTFRSLYVNPLVDILNHQNPSTQFIEAKNNGVFDENYHQTLVLLVDIKTEPIETFKAVQNQLSALRDRGYLTHFDGKDVIFGPITVVGTGNTPFDLVVANTTYRDIFFDAPLNEFSAKEPTAAHKTYNTTNSYYASTSLYELVGLPWRAGYSDSQKEKMVDRIKGAQMVGLKARYWETPGWPVLLRNYVWDFLVKEGVDVLNADDVLAATHGKWGHWG